MHRHTGSIILEGFNPTRYRTFTDTLVESDFDPDDDKRSDTGCNFYSDTMITNYKSIDGYNYSQAIVNIGLVLLV